MKKRKPIFLLLIIACLLGHEPLLAMDLYGRLSTGFLLGNLDLHENSHEWSMEAVLGNPYIDFPVRAYLGFFLLQIRDIRLDACWGDYFQISLGDGIPNVYDFEAVRLELGLHWDAECF